MNYKEIQFTYLIFFASVLFISCSRSLPVFNNWHGDIAEKRGKYIFKEKDLELDLFDKDGILRYFLIKNHKDTLVRAQENASVYQSFFLYLDDKENLWVSSSDIGDWVWLKSNGIYTKHYLTEIDSKLIPQKFWDHLPESFKASYKK